MDGQGGRNLLGDARSLRAALVAAAHELLLQQGPVPWLAHSSTRISLDPPLPCTPCLAPLPVQVGLRLSPFGGFLDASDSHPYALTRYLLEELNK